MDLLSIQQWMFASCYIDLQSPGFYSSSFLFSNHIMMMMMG